MFSVVYGGAYIGHIHDLAPHQLCSPNRRTTTNCTCKKCKTMVRCCQYQLEMEFWSHECPQTSHPHYTVCVQFMMLSEEWNDDCFLYWVLSYHLWTSSPSSHSPRPCLLCQCQRRSLILFLPGILPAPHDSPESWSIVEWSLQTSFCSMVFHCTTNSITRRFLVASCKENRLCFDGKVFFIGTWIKEVLEIFILPTTTVRNLIDLCDVWESLLQESHQ